MLLVQVIHSKIKMDKSKMDESKMAAQRTCNHFGLEEIENFIRKKEYPDRIAKNDYGVKSNFRRAAKKFSIKDCYMFKENKLVIKDRSRQRDCT